MYCLIVDFCICTGNTVTARVVEKEVWRDCEGSYILQESSDYAATVLQADAIRKTVKIRATYRKQRGLR